MPHAVRFVLAVALIAGCGPSTPPLATPSSPDGTGAAERLADLDWLLATVARRAAYVDGLDADAIRAHGHRSVHFVPDRAALASELARLVRPGDIVLTLGAGDISQTGGELLTLLAGR